MRKRAVRAALNAARNRPGAARRRTRSRGCRVEACRRSVVARGSDLRSSRSSQSSVSWPSMAPSRGSRYLRQSSSSSERASTRYVVTSPMPSRTTTGPAAPGGSSSGVRIRAPLGSGGAGHAPTAARDRAELPWLAGRRGQAVGEPDREHSTSEAKARRAARTVVPGHRAPDRSAAAPPRSGLPDAPRLARASQRVVQAPPRPRRRPCNRDDRRPRQGRHGRGSPDRLPPATRRALPRARRA